MMALSVCAGSIQHNVSETVLAIHIPEGAHHLDLMFSHPDDPPSVRVARQFEMAQVRHWVAEHHAKNGMLLDLPSRSQTQMKL